MTSSRRSSLRQHDDNESYYIYEEVTVGDTYYTEYTRNEGGFCKAIFGCIALEGQSNNPEELREPDVDDDYSLKKNSRNGGNHRQKNDEYNESPYSHSQNRSSSRRSKPSDPSDYEPNRRNTKDDREAVSYDGDVRKDKHQMRRRGEKGRKSWKHDEGKHSMSTIDEDFDSVLSQSATESFRDETSIQPRKTSQKMKSKEKQDRKDAQKKNAKKKSKDKRGERKGRGDGTSDSGRESLDKQRQVNLPEVVETYPNDPALAHGDNIISHADMYREPHRPYVNDQFNSWQTPVYDQHHQDNPGMIGHKMVDHNLQGIMQPPSYPHAANHYLPQQYFSSTSPANIMLHDNFRHNMMIQSRQNSPILQHSSIERNRMATSTNSPSPMSYHNSDQHRRPGMFLGSQQAVSSSSAVPTLVDGGNSEDMSDISLITVGQKLMNKMSGTNKLNHNKGLEPIMEVDSNNGNGRPPLLQAKNSGMFQSGSPSSRTIPTTASLSNSGLSNSVSFGDASILSRVKVRNRFNGIIDNTELVELRVPPGDMAIALKSSPHGLIVERIAPSSVAPELNAGDAIVALDGVDVSMFPAKIVKKLIKARSSQTTRAIVYRPASSVPQDTHSLGLQQNRARTPSPATYSDYQVPYYASQERGQFSSPMLNTT